MFSFFNPVRTECKNCSCKNSLENEREFSCFETNGIFCLNGISLITNSYADYDKVCFASLNSVNNLNESDSLKCSRRILLNDVKLKSGFDFRYAHSSSVSILHIASQISVSVYPLVLAFGIW